MEIYIDYKRKKRNTAGAKAPADIASLCRHRHMRRFAMPKVPQGLWKGFNLIWLTAVGVFYWGKLCIIAKEGDVILYQHPMYGNRLTLRAIPIIRKLKKCSFVALIHDLESLRKGIEGVIQNREKTNNLADNQLLKEFDCVICHNEHMKKYMIENGFDPEKLVCLEIFDYLSKVDRKQPGKGVVPSVCIAGNLAKGKSGYIYNILKESSNLNLHLYGINFDEQDAKAGLIYHGSFEPAQLPKYLEGDFGLVWDGPGTDSCEGNTGEYLKYNNPHKTSLYLSSNMPVIVWSQAAIADFILKYNLGIAVDSLSELEEKINGISEEDYYNICQNVRRVSKRLRNGFYFYKAYEQCLERINLNKK